MNFRDEAVECISDAIEQWEGFDLERRAVPTFTLDVLLNWLDTNAERIADDPDHTGDSWIRRLVAVLREDTE